MAIDEFRRRLPEDAVGALRRLGSHRGSCLYGSGYNHPDLLAGSHFFTIRRRWLSLARYSEKPDVARATWGMKTRPSQRREGLARTSTVPAPPQGAEARCSALQLSRDGDFALKSFWPPIETHLALELAANHILHYARTEAVTRGWLDQRAVGLDPAQNE
jgi:hypothetical protein